MGRKEAYTDISEAKRCIKTAIHDIEGPLVAGRRMDSHEDY